MQELFRQTRQNFSAANISNDFYLQSEKSIDYVIIDTPPLGSVIDSAVIADECDGSIIVMESGVISYRFAQDVKGQLEKCN